MSVSPKNKQPKKEKKEIDYNGQQPYCELPINMTTFNNNIMGYYANIVFEGFNKNYKSIKIDTLKYFGNNEDWYSGMMTPEIILKRTLFLLYLKIWANSGDIIKKAKNIDEEKKIDKYSLEYINVLNKRWNTLIVEELKIVFKKLLDKEVQRVYIVMVSYGDGEGIIISDNMKAKGYTEWMPEEKNKNVDLDTLATKFFSLNKIKNLREEGLVYIKQLDAKYDKQLEAEKEAVPVVEVKTGGGRKNAKRKLFKFNF
jgi:hypothetical protein